VEGLLQDFRLTDMLQLFDLSQKTGVIELVPIGYQQQGSSPNPAFPIGRVYFVDGRVTDANLSSLRGEDALFSLFLWQAGAFRFINAASSATRTINQTTESLLMVGTRRIDEWANILQRVPTLQITIFCPPTPPPNAQAIRLNDTQWRFLQNLRGQETVATVARRCGLSPFQARILATGLLTLELLKRRPPTEAECYFEELVQSAARDLGELAEPLVETLFNQAGLPPSRLATLHAVSPTFAAQILPELEAAAARYIGPQRAHRLRQRVTPLAQQTS